VSGHEWRAQATDVVDPDEPVAFRRRLSQIDGPHHLSGASREDSELVGGYDGDAADDGIVICRGRELDAARVDDGLGSSGPRQPQQQREQQQQAARAHFQPRHHLSTSCNRVKGDPQRRGCTKQARTARRGKCFENKGNTRKPRSAKRLRVSALKTDGL
jgi:hypothetical protein